ncbi:MAG: heavy metal translocating P-type ATPase [Candidatus Promineifilaceae bacterium]
MLLRHPTSSISLRSLTKSLQQRTPISRSTHTLSEQLTQNAPHKPNRPISPATNRQSLAQRLNSSQPQKSVATPRTIEQVRQHYTNIIRSVLQMNEARDQQLRAISEDIPAISAAEAELNRKSRLFLTSFGTASVATLISPQLAILGLPACLYILKDVYKGSYEALFKQNELTIDTLVALLVTLFIASGSYLLCNLYLVLFLSNRKLLFKLKNQSSNNIVDVFKQQPRTVWLLADGAETKIAFDQLKLGDKVVVHAGETIPVDGTIVTGVATIDQQLLTGESQPVEREADDKVFAMTVVLSGRVVLRVDKAGTETTVAQIGQILNQTVDAKTDMQLWAERITDKTVLPTVVLAGLALPFAGSLSAMIVLNSHFRYRLNIITATSVLNFLNLASQQGILIKDGRSLEVLNQVDTVVFDKTGTLTLEQPHIGRIYTNPTHNEETILQYAAIAEYKQTHPIAKAILDAAAARNLELPKIDQAEYKIGYGVIVTLGNRTIRVGSTRFMQMEACAIDATIEAAQTHCQSQGHSLVLVAVDDKVIGAIELHATIRPEVDTIIEKLRARFGESLYIISGDQEMATRKLAHDVGIHNYFAETLPENKSELIGQLQASGKSVCYIGDGINDSIALKKAEISVSLRGASSVAIDSADIVLMDGTLNQLETLFTLAESFENNLKWTFRGIVAPCLLNLGGLLLPQFTLMHSMALSGVSVAAGFGSAMQPLLSHHAAQVASIAAHHNGSTA